MAQNFYEMEWASGVWEDGMVLLGNSLDEGATIF
jgi:hypothetical protein